MEEFNIPSIMQDIARDLKNELILACPVDKSALIHSIKVTPMGLTLIISMIEYGKYVEYGTPPHIILPKEGKAIAWGKKVGTTEEGKPMWEFVRKKVMHPGTRPQPFIRNTIHTKLPGIIKKRLEG